MPWAKAGIIIKASTRPGSAYAAMMVTGGHGVRMQYDYTGDMPGLAGAVSAASPRWLRLTRSGDTITGYDSANGTHWTKVGTVTLAGLPRPCRAACSPRPRRTRRRPWACSQLEPAAPARPPASSISVSLARWLARRRLDRRRYRRPPAAPPPGHPAVSPRQPAGSP